MIRFSLGFAAEWLRAWAHRELGWYPCEYPPDTYDYQGAPRRCEMCGRPE